MFQIKFIDNLAFNIGKLCAEGRMGYPTAVFLRQGQLDGAGGVYSLLMLLILHKRINREDLIFETCSNDPPYVKRLKKQILYPIKGLYPKGTSLSELREKLLRVFDNQIHINIYDAFDNENKEEEAKILRSKIKEQLDAGWPVLCRYSQPNIDVGHAVVAIGYTICENFLRLYCLDPSDTIPWFSIWNNIINMKMYCGNEEWPDYNYKSERKINIDEILLIEENEVKDSSLPF